MNIKIGEVIKRLRLEQSITQEALAGHLNISAQSVSKWENGLSFPDITLIPAIALFFGVSTDELFSLSTYIDSQKFIAYQNTYENLRIQGATKEQIALCRQMLLEYPRNFLVMSNLATSLVSSYEGLDASHQIALENDYLKEAVKLSEIILSDCKDAHLKLIATKILCKYYPHLNQIDKALTLVNNLPSISSCKELMLTDILTHTDCIRQQQDNLLQFTDLIAQTLVHLSFRKGKCIPSLNAEDKIHFILTSNELYKLIITDDNYLFFHKRLAWNYRRLAELYLLKDNPDQCISYLLKSAYHAKSYDQLPASSNYTSKFASSCQYKKEDYAKDYAENECSLLYYMLTQQGAFDSLKDYPDFKVLLQNLSS